MAEPVPLTDIERRRFWPISKGQFHYVTLRQPERDALCEALRIAVEVLVWTTENFTPAHDERLRDRNDGCWCVSCESRRTLARVRELVDLGEKP